ncbi:MAG: type I-B CRISPR-associated protein Cas5b [Deltaproteobacteria bacterium]|jgi:CRISPR-associated protein Cas5h|uniref:Type I-B CRISPR-associated protein Cas5 n=1 Tax=Candidatus Acididesulfobacter diazotrophicus TaxID=2597226 RepID=A0A519BMQ0_9DELT|nr:type I-B CRISPR-associated protein Cas5b [Deltaproteobacteria bacterium]RZD18543.1 MAG: type I-B CRISPR-associated protein Cas5 [Candidatus Acididesulfobacter diazotrophicus]
MKICVFDIWADYAHFRKYYTTTSPLSFSFPPPSTIAGILGAIIGLDKNTNEYLKVFNLDESKISLRILNPIKKVRVGINLLETKGSNMKHPMSDKMQPHTQIRTELLRDPKYRIYISNSNETIFTNLINNLKNHETVYTVSLGLSELLADFQYIEVYEYEEISYDNSHSLTEICSPIVEDNIVNNEFEIEDDKQYFKETKMPINMNCKRIVSKYTDVMFELTGKTIKTKLNKYYKLENGENITPF